MSLSSASPVNRILAALPGKSRARARCELIRLSGGDVLAEPGERLRAVHFPAGSLISLVAVVDTETSLEIALIGQEGMLGVPLALGGATSSTRARVQESGAAWRLDAADFRRAVLDYPALRRRIDRYLAVLLTKLGQSSACAGFHRLEARLARRLLEAHERSSDDSIYLTHGVLAKILGVRRSGVTMAAVELQRRRLIQYSRGGIKILDRAGLEQAACACYRAPPKARGAAAAQVPV